MIQRIQSIYFLIASAALLFNGYSPGIKRIDLTSLGVQMGNYGITKEVFVYGSFVTGIIGLVTLLGYKNRPRQIRFARMGMLMSVGMVVVWGILYYKMSQIPAAAKLLSFQGGILAIISSLGFALGAKAVAKDQKLVKSLDRIR